MKNMNKRTQIILTIIGILIVVVAALNVVITQTPVSQLSGAAVLAISPSDPVLTVGETIKFVIHNTPGCIWSIEDPSIASIVGNSEGPSVKILAGAVGKTRLDGRCGVSVLTQVHTNVTVTAHTTPR